MAIKMIITGENKEHRELKRKAWHYLHSVHNSHIIGTEVQTCNGGGKIIDVVGIGCWSNGEIVGIEVKATKEDLLGDKNFKADEPRARRIIKSLLQTRVDKLFVGVPSSLVPVALNKFKDTPIGVIDLENWRMRKKAIKNKEGADYDKLRFMLEDVARASTRDYKALLHHAKKNGYFEQKEIDETEEIREACKELEKQYTII